MSLVVGSLKLLLQEHPPIASPPQTTEAKTHE